ncbi:MAG: NAD(+) kinase [Gammaproteobacteria bacterium]
MTAFKTIGLMGRQRSSESNKTLTQLIKHLERKHKLVLEKETAEFLNQNDLPIYSKTEFAKQCDLVIVVGGDGSILNAAHIVADTGTPVLGVNRGRVGFLTDINPASLTEQVDEVLAGQYFTEQRFLLKAEIQHQGKITYHALALNDVVLMPGDFAHLIEFEIEIDEKIVCGQRADGLIISTPTGSTAYALSAGGPILHPNLDAVVLVPMLPQTLSSRPIVVHANHQINIIIPKGSETSPRISCDGQKRVAIGPGDKLIINKYQKPLNLLHPKNYDYYETLRSKLYWQMKL